MAIDGLFVWLAAQGQSQHLNIVHAGSIWTAQASEMVIMTDPTLIFIIGYFLSMPKMNAHYDKDQSLDSDYVHPLCHPGVTEGSYIHIPPVLNKPVKDPIDRAFEADVVLKGNELPLQCLLANLMQCKVDDYQFMLVAWMLEYHSDLHMMEKWLAVQDLDLETYAVHLSSCRLSDGLELWLASQAMNRPITMIMEDTVISTSVHSPDFAQLTFLLSHYIHGYLCSQDAVDPLLEMDLAGKTAAAPSASMNHALGGQPMVKDVPDLSSPDNNSETDPNELLEESDRELCFMPKLGRSKACICLICQ